MRGMDVAELAGARSRDIKDFPTEGILFKDITTLLKDGPAWRFAVDALASQYQSERVDGGGRGRIARLHLRRRHLPTSCGRASCRSASSASCPAKTISVEYELEYGRDALAMHGGRDQARASGCCAVDDLLATGGTMAATLRLIEQLGVQVVGWPS